MHAAFLAAGQTLSGAILTVVMKWLLTAYPHPSALILVQIVAAVSVTLVVRVTGLVRSRTQTSGNQQLPLMLRASPR